MNIAKAYPSLRQGLNLLVLLIGPAVLGTAILLAAPPSNDFSETVPLPSGQELILTGEVVMIEGTVRVVEDPSGGKTEAHLIMDHLYVAQVIGETPIECQVNEKTRMDETIQVGDTVEVLVAQNGEALSIKKTE